VNHHASLTNDCLQALLQADDARKAAALRILRGERAVPTGPHFLTGTGAARLLGVSRTTLRRWLRIAGVTSVEVLPRCYRYRRTDIEELAQRAVRADPPAPDIRSPRRGPSAAGPQLPNLEEQTNQPKE
jgi:hypothetical protein